MNEIKEKLELVKATIDDVDEEYVGWLNNPKINKFIEKKNSTMEDCKRYVSKMITTPDNRIFFIVVDSQKIGTVTISNIDHDKNNCTIGIMIGNDKYLHKGYGLTALENVIKYIGNELGITAINIGCDIDNIPAIECYHKVGFKDKYIFMTRDFEREDKTNDCEQCPIYKTGYHSPSMCDNLNCKGMAKV
jgi:RimJ/RimL family protein N-acetyltransferase